MQNTSSQSVDKNRLTKKAFFTHNYVSQFDLLGWGYTGLLYIFTIKAALCLQKKKKMPLKIIWLYGYIAIRPIQILI